MYRATELVGRGGEEAASALLFWRWEAACLSRALRAALVFSLAGKTMDLSWMFAQIPVDRVLS